MKFLKVLVGWVFILLLIGGGAAAAGLYWLNAETNRPGALGEVTVVKVEPGESLAAVATRLEADGIIGSALAMRIVARRDGTEGALKTGEFEIPAGATLRQVIDMLIKGRALQYRLTIPEGRTTAQILKLVAAEENLTGDVPRDLYAEGTLLPDTYAFERGTSRADLLNRMAKAQDDLMDELWPKRMNDLPIKDQAEAIILASVVEKETGNAGEQPQIAGLFITRMHKGMPLQSDPTIIYGISKGEPLYNAKGERRTLLRSEINKKTDWNTYQIDRLPKTPICNPGRGAIAAVLNPDPTGHIFFVADGKGGHLFARTLEEHNANVAKYRAYEREEIAREREN